MEFFIKVKEDVDFKRNFENKIVFISGNQKEKSMRSKRIFSGHV
jgi:hypothetical protein